MDFKELIEAFAAQSGVTGTLPFDEKDICHLPLKNRDVGFMKVPQLDRLLVWTVIGQKPVEGVETFYEQLLKANFMGQTIPEGAFSLSDDGSVYAHRTFVLSMIGTDELKEGVDRFLSAVEDWSEMTDMYGRVMNAVAEEHPKPKLEDEGKMIRSGFMQV